MKRYYVFALLFFLSMIIYFDRVVLSITMPALEKAFALTPVSEGYLLSAFFWIYIPMQIPAGAMLDRLGTRRLTSWAVVLWSLATAAAALATNLSTLFLARLLLGIGEAPSFPCGLRAVREWAPQRERAQVTAIFISGATFGSAVSAFVVGWIVSVAGWRAAFVAAGGIGLVWTVLWLLVFRDPRDANWLSEQERQDILSSRTAGGTEGQGLPVSRLARYPAMWGLMLALGCLNYTNYVALGWLPTYLVRVRGMDVLHSGMQFGTIYVCAGILTLVFGRLSDKVFSRRPLGSRRYGVVFFSLVASLMLLVPFIQSPTGLIIVLTAVITGMQGANTNVFSLASDLLVAGGGMGKAIAFLQVGGNIFGVSAPIVTGYLLQITGGFSAAFVVAGLLILIGAVACLLMARHPVGELPGDAVVPAELLSGRAP
jgi:MFS family permease